MPAGQYARYSVVKFCGIHQWKRIKFEDRHEQDNGLLAGEEGFKHREVTPDGQETNGDVERVCVARISQYMQGRALRDEVS